MSETDLQKVDALIEHNIASTVKLMEGLTDTRLKHGLSVSDVATILGWSTEKVCEFEAYYSDPTLSEIRRYASAIGVSITVTTSYLPDVADITKSLGSCHLCKN